MENKIKFETPVDVESTTIRYNGEDIVIKSTIDFGNMLRIVSEVFDGSFDENGIYSPELTDFYIRKEIIESYSNVELSSNPIDAYNIIYNTELYNLVLVHINQDQIADIFKSIDRRIGYSLKIDEKAKNKKIDEIISSFESLGNKFDEILGGTSADFFSTAIASIKENGVDEEAIAKAYIDNMKEE